MVLKVEAEVQLPSEPCVIAWDHKLFVGTEDGSIHSFDKNLAGCGSWVGHAVQAFALAAGEGRVYSASNDGGVRVWAQNGAKIADLSPTGGDIGALHLSANHLYAGDETGNIVVYEDNKEIARYNLLEEVKDLAFHAPYLFSVRDLDVTVTEIKPNESKNRYTTRKTLEGRAPLRLASGGTKLLAMTRGGDVMRLHSAAADTDFKKLSEVKVSDMIVTSLSVSGEFAWTGGWDGWVRRWHVSGGLEPAGEVKLGACVNAIVAAQPDELYAAVAGGKLVKIKSDQ